MVAGNQIELKPIDEGDLEQLRSWRNSYAEQFFTHDYITKQQQRIWYEHYQQNFTDNMFMIQLKDGTKIGSIALYNINLSDRTANIGRILILEDYQGKGFAEDAIRVVKRIAFENMKLYKLKLETFLDNAAAISLYHRCGFVANKRPIMLMECKNVKINWLEAVKVESYDEMSGDAGHEGQCGNVSER